MGEATSGRVLGLLDQGGGPLENDRVDATICVLFEHRHSARIEAHIFCVTRQKRILISNCLNVIILSRVSTRLTTGSAAILGDKFARVRTGRTGARPYRAN